jgi:phage shock protein A
MKLERLLREFMAPAPDPRRSNRHTDRLEREVLREVRTALDTITESRSQLAARTAQLRSRLPRLEEEARHALAEGRRDVAQHMLERHQIVAAELGQLERQFRAVDLEADRLALVEQQLAARIDALLARERTLEARRSAAEAQVRVGEALAGISAEIADLCPELAHAEQQTEELEARGVAIDRLLEVGPLEAVEIEHALAELEHQVENADDRGVVDRRVVDV